MWHHNLQHTPRLCFTACGPDGAGKTIHRGTKCDSISMTLRVLADEQCVQLRCNHCIECTSQSSNKNETNPHSILAQQQPAPPAPNSPCAVQVKQAGQSNPVSHKHADVPPKLPALDSPAACAKANTGLALA